MKRILVVNVNWRGDVLFSTPFIRAIRENSPQAFIACLVVPRCASILKNNPRLNEVIVFDESGRHKGFLGKLRLIVLLRSKHFDTAFLLHRSLTRTIICWAAGIKQRVGYYTRKRALFLTKSIIAPVKPLHKVDYFLNIAKAYGIQAENKNYEFFPEQKDTDYIENLFQQNGLRENDFLVVINPGGNWDLKRWPKERFARLGDELIKRQKARIIITGAEKDIDLAREIAALMKHSPLILCGKTTLEQLAALMSKVGIVISNDSGPMHIAVSQNTKVICIFGPTSPEITGPYGRGSYTVVQKEVDCIRPCYKLNCQDNRCMKEISVEDVLQAVEEIKADKGR